MKTVEKFKYWIKRIWTSNVIAATRLWQAIKTNAKQVSWQTLITDITDWLATVVVWGLCANLAIHYVYNKPFGIVPIISLGAGIWLVIDLLKETANAVKTTEIFDKKQRPR